MCVAVCYSAVDAEREEHEEEDDGPEGRAGHHADGERIGDEYEARSRIGHLLDRLALHVRHVAECREDHEA